MKNWFQKIISFIEKFIPMTFGSLILFAFIIYLSIVVGKSVISNYESNKSIEKEEIKLVELEARLHNIQNEINYYQTYSFKEKEARAKLGYKAPGENVLSLTIDTEEEKVADTSLVETKIKVSNFHLWWQYFFR
jgi:cell division protein FtsB